MVGVMGGPRCARPPAPPPLGSAASLHWRYYLVMLSAAAVVAGLGVVSAFTAGNANVVPEMLFGTAIFLVVLNLIGATLLFRPIARRLGSDVPGSSFPARVRTLPVLSALWIFVLTSGAMTVHAGAVFGSWAAFVSSSASVVLHTAVQCVLFAGYLALYTYLTVGDYTTSMRRDLWVRGIVIPFRRGRFMMRLIGTVAAVVLGPVLLSLTDHASETPASRSAESMRSMMSGAPDGMSMPMAMQAHNHQQYMEQTLHMDVLAALILSGLIVFLLARGLSRSVDELLDAMGQIDRGDFRTRAPVVTDDEFGRLTERFNQMLDGLDERERMRRTFERFVPESVAGALIADEGAIQPQEREATVLFTDIERFTQIASSLSARAVVSMLNAYFGQVAGIVHRHGGVITQFQGDAVLASFNLPASDPQHAEHALRAALEIQQRLGETTFNDGIRLRTRIGICTGMVVGGTVGGGERLGYTVHGDTVNLAARLEQLNKELGTTVLISERTVALLPPGTALRDRGELPVRGFGERMRVFEPLAAVEAEAATERARTFAIGSP